MAKNDKPAEEKAPEASGRIVFRNNQDRIFYLKRRPEQPDVDANFVLGPGATVEALDEEEEKLLSHMGLVDVKKETPALGNAIDQLQKQLAEAQAKNVELLAQKEDLEKQVNKGKGK